MKINWFLRITFYCIICFAIGPYYDGWVSSMFTLILAGYFEKFYDIETPEDEKNLNYEMISVLSYFRVGEFCSSIIWGIMLDSCLGPRYTIIAGILLRFVSWLIIAYGNSINGMLIIAALIGGISTNAITLPCYTISAYRLDWREYGMCLLSISLSLATFYCFIFNTIFELMELDDAGHFILVSHLIIMIPIGIACWFVFPRRLEDDVKCNLTIEDDVKGNSTALDVVISDSITEDKNWNWNGFYQQLIRQEMLLITLIFSVNCFSLTFAQETFLFNYVDYPSAIISNTFLIPLSAVFALFFGWIIKRFGVLLVLLLFNFFSLITHFCMLFNSATAGIISSIFISITYSGFITFFLIYLDYIVPSIFASSCKGYLITIGGFACLINILVNYLSSFNKTATYYITVGLIFLRIFLFFPFWLLMKRRT